jgi:hypothetical protein
MAMRLSLASTYKRTGSLAVIAVTLWLGGFGCSLCCATAATDSCCLRERQASARATASAAGATSCDTGAACSCCKSHGAGSPANLTDTAIGREGAIGCSLLPNRIEGVTAQVRIAEPLTTQSELPAPLFTPYRPARTASLREAPPPLNRGGTYLRCGALLI